jgi:hypothetical protein
VTDAGIQALSTPRIGGRFYYGWIVLGVAALAMVGKWFRRRLTRAMAVYALVMSVGQD